MNRFIWLGAVCALLFVLACGLLYKIYLMKKAAREIRTLLSEKLSSDTNTLITVSSGDKELRALAEVLNRELLKLRAQKHRFVNGDKELKEAVTNISHDLRTPLTAISGYLELLGREEKSERVQEYLDAVKNRTDAMKELTEELFGYSIVMADEKAPVLERVSLTGVIEEAVSGMYGAFVEKGIAPQISMPEETVYCTADKKGLSRIVSNILNNALKYSDGDLRIELSKTGEVRFSNSAEGLSHVDVGRLFDRFYTVDAARRSTGLGLSIARHLAEQMGAGLTAVYEKPELTIILRMRSAAVGNGAGKNHALGFEKDVDRNAVY